MLTCFAQFLRPAKLQSSELRPASLRLPASSSARSPKPKRHERIRCGRGLGRGRFAHSLDLADQEANLFQKQPLISSKLLGRRAWPHTTLVHSIFSALHVCTWTGSPRRVPSPDLQLLLRPHLSLGRGIPSCRLEFVDQQLPPPRRADGDSQLRYRK